MSEEEGKSKKTYLVFGENNELSNLYYNYFR